jgi:hypothetical protein
MLKIYLKDKKIVRIEDINYDKVVESNLSLSDNPVIDSKTGEIIPYKKSSQYIEQKTALEKEIKK